MGGEHFGVNDTACVAQCEIGRRSLAACRGRKSGREGPYLGGVNGVNGEMGAEGR